MVQTGAIGAMSGHSVIHVSHGNDARFQRDLFSLEPIGVAGAIPPLVMVTRDEGFSFETPDAQQQLVAGNTVLPH